MRRLPDFVIIGAMKCASSTLHTQLELQPGFYMSDPKEPNFFSDDENYGKGLDSYAGLFEGARETDLCGESSTHYTKRPTHPETVERMKRAIPDAKLVYIMRDPLARLVSHYIHDWTENLVQGDIDEAVQERPELIEYGRYSMQLEPFLQAYGPKRILPMFLERVMAEPQLQLERLCSFLGYRGRPEWNEEKARENSSEQRLRKSKIRDAIVYSPGLSYVRKTFVPQSLRDKVKSIWQMKSRPQLGEATLEKVRRIFDEDLARLGPWLGMDLRCGPAFGEAVRKTDPDWREAVEKVAG